MKCMPQSHPGCWDSRVLGSILCACSTGLLHKLNMCLFVVFSSGRRLQLGLWQMPSPFCDLFLMNTDVYSMRHPGRAGVLG